MNQIIQTLSDALNVAHAAMLKAFQAEEAAYDAYNRAMLRVGYDEKQRQREYDEAAEESATAQLNFNSIKREWEALTSNPETGEIEAQGAF